MQLPVLSSLRELSAPPRRFLLFSVFNVISWQCIVGPAMVLFARKTEMPASWVGFLISCLPFSMLLVGLTLPLVTRLGPKRIMLMAWLLRNIVVCSVFLIPWAISVGGPRMAWYVLIGATLAFCLARSLGVGGWFPWLHEVVPEGERGTYFSTEMALVQLINVVLILGQGLFLQGNPGVNRFLAIYAGGIVFGMLSLVYMSRIPGGAGFDETSSMGQGLASYGIAFRDRRFLCFVLIAMLCMSSISWLSASVVLYLRDALHYVDRSIMALMAVGSGGVLLTIRPWGRFADHSGSGRAIFKALTAHSLAALAFLALFPGGRWTPYAVCPVIALMAVFAGAFWVATHRAMLNLVPESGRAGYTNLWIVGSAASMGVTPILAGFLIDSLGLWGFRACFLISGILGLCSAFASERVVGDGTQARLTRAWTMNPALPLRTLARIAWITLGMHESNRAERTARGGTPAR